MRHFKSALRFFKIHRTQPLMDLNLSLNKTEKGLGPKQPKLVWPGLACMGVAY